MRIRLSGRRQSVYLLGPGCVILALIKLLFPSRTQSTDLNISMIKMTTNYLLNPIMVKPTIPLLVDSA